MKKIPTYLGFFVENEGELLSDVKQKLLKVSKIVKGIEQGGISSVKELHVTCLFIGGSKEKSKSKIAQNFKFNQKEQTQVQYLVCAPGSLIAAVCSPAFQVDNKHPHITLFLWPKVKPFLSNQVLARLHSQPGYEEARATCRKQGVAKVGQFWLIGLYKSYKGVMRGHY